MPVEVPPLDLKPGEYAYSHDWFERDYGSKPHIKRESTRQLYERLLLPQAKSIRRIMEIGVSEGRSVVWFLQNIIPDAWLGIDPWLPGRGETYEPGQRMMRFWHNMEVISGGVQTPMSTSEEETYFSVGKTKCCLAYDRSQRWLCRENITQQFDLIIIDGLHHGWGAMTDAVLSWPLLAKNGLIIFDDTHRRWQHGKAHVHEACMGFHMGFEGWVRREFENGRQTWLRKIRDT